MSWEEKGRMSAGVDEERIMGIDLFTVHCACRKLSNTMFKKRKGGGKTQYLNVCATNTPGLLTALQNLMKSFHTQFSMYFLFMPFKTTSLKILDYQSCHFD